MRRLSLVALGLAASGCFDFGGDLQRCRQEGRCPPEAAVAPAGGLCSQGVCWEHPFPTAAPVTALYAPNADELFVGGSAGVVVHLKGRSAEIAYLGRPEPPALGWPRIAGLAGCSTGVSAMTADRQLFTLGDAGFTPAVLPPPPLPTTVAQGWTGPGPTCAFAGNQGQAVWVAQEQAGKLAPLNSPSTNSPFWRRITALGGTSLDDLWFASTIDVQTRSADGGVGPDVVPTPDGGLNGPTGVCSLGSGEVFASTLSGIRARSSGWGPLGADKPLTAIACLPQAELVAIGGGVVRRCLTDGGCVEVTGAEAWQAATVWNNQALIGSQTGELARVSGSSAVELSRLSTGVREDLFDVALGPNGEAWAAGAHATLLRRTDGGWVPVDANVAPTDDLFAVAVLGDGRVLVGGRGGVLRVLNLDGGVEKPKLFQADGTLIQNQKLNQDLRRFAQQGSRAWAVGTGATMLREADDGSWHLVNTTSNSSDHWYDLRFNDAGVGWATGEGAGVIESRPNGGWALIRGPFSSYAFLTLFIDSKGAVWFAGRSGLAMRLNPDAGQQSFRFPGSNDDIVGFVEQPDALYAVGRRSLYRFVSEPLQWEIIGPLPLDPGVNAIQAVAANGDDFWVVGRSGAILRVNRALWLRSP